jgi:hypothetical protein
VNPELIELRITLGDMSDEDAFRIVVPCNIASVTIRDLLDGLFPDPETPDSETEADQVMDMLDTRANPDLPEMYVELAEMLSGWRAGTSRIDLKSSTGAPVLPSDQASAWFAPGPTTSDIPDPIPTFHLMFEHRFLPLDAYARDGGSRQELLAWMRGCVLIYFLDKHHGRVTVEPLGESDSHVQTAAGDLQAQGLLSASATEEIFEITPAGRAYIGNLMSETESYIRNFDVFGDVIPGNGLRPTEFGTGRGMDLRVQAYFAEGVDAHRAVFLLRMYDGTLDSFESTWRSRMEDEDFFQTLLEPALDFSQVAEEVLDLVFEAGGERDRTQARVGSGMPIQSRPPGR